MGSCARVWVPRFVVVTTAVQVFVLTPTPASADLRVSPSLGEAGSTAFVSSGLWDPDDVEGLFDFRWVGAAYTSTGKIHLSVSFYDAFRLRRLPAPVLNTGTDSYVSVWLSGALNGYFLRKGGRVIFEWGDFGSTCCKTADVTRPRPGVFSVIFNPCSYVYGEEIEMALGESYWRTQDIRARDRTGEVELSHPKCEGWPRHAVNGRIW
jgi:hypothetical protein